MAIPSVFYGWKQDPDIDDLGSNIEADVLDRCPDDCEYCIHAPKQPPAAAPAEDDSVIRFERRTEEMDEDLTGVL
jgi:hypothetical protein